MFAIGDCALIPNVDDPDGPPHAATAQNAVREAKALAHNIVAHIDGKPAKPFRYRPLGQLASIGHHTGVGVVFGIRVRGTAGVVHVARLLLEPHAGLQPQGRTWRSTGC